MATPTAIRVSKDVAIAVAHQTAYGTPAGTTSVQTWQVTSFVVDPGYVYIHPRGTVGSHHPKDTHTKVAERPRVTLDVLASPKVLPFIWEHVLHGQPTATLANSDITEAGDTNNDCSVWVLNGIRPGFNTSSDFKLYGKIEDEQPGAGQARISLYSDSGRTALVAQGSAVDGGSVTLAAQNNSGLSGTVTIGTVGADNLTSLILTIVQVRPQISGTLARYFTIWRDHGSGKALERVADCTIQKLTRTSDEAGVVSYRLEIVGSDYTYTAAGGGVITPGLATGDKEYMVHGTMTVNTDVDSGNVAQHALRMEVSVENNIDPVLANAATASAIYKRGVNSYGIMFTQRLSDESQVVTGRGITDSYEAITIVDAYGARNTTLVFDKCKSVEPKFPEIAEDGWGIQTHTFQAVEETAASPTAPIAVTIQL